jgi:hypothetical protein
MQLTHPSLGKTTVGLAAFGLLFNKCARRTIVATATLTATVFSVNCFSQAVPLGSGVTAQLVETSQGLFYQKDALTWGLNASSLALMKRNPNYITLQDLATMDRYTLDLQERKVKVLKATTTTPTDFGLITKVVDASGPGLNGVSVLLRSPDRLVHVDADRYFAPAGEKIDAAMTSDGTPGQWGRKIYRAMGASFSPSKGPTANRVDLKDGSRLEKHADGTWREYRNDSYSYTDEWLRTPAGVFTELRRDEWSVYLTRSVWGPKVQIDLYTKKVTFTGTVNKVVEILPEKFPYYWQFLRESSNLMDDAAFKTNANASSATLKTTNSSVTSIDLLTNTCRVSGAGYTDCQVLLGEFEPRGITGYSLGGLSTTMLGRGNSLWDIEYFDLGFQGGAFKAIVMNRSDTNALKALIPEIKGRAGVRFSDGVYLSLSGKTLGSVSAKDGGWVLTGVQQYIPGQMKGFLPYPNPKLSPGFQIQNRTDHDVLVTLEQVGCLYYGTVKPGETFYRETGAVWFTVKAVIAPDLKPPTDLSCASKPALMVATVVAAGVSGGTAAVPMAMLTGMVQGAAYATTSFVESKGGTELEAIAAKTAVIAVGGGLVGGLNGIVTMSNQMVPNVGKALAAGGLTAIVSELSQTKLDKMTAELTQSASLFGQYAGYPWPWKTVDRVMPIYEITGGPIRTQLQGGGVLYQYQKTPLTIRKTN